MPWECYKCTFINKSSPSRKGPCIMRMHDNPPRIKAEVGDARASPSPAPKTTEMMVTTKALMLDVASLKAFVEAVMMESAMAAAKESALAAATMVGMTRGGNNSGKPRAQQSHAENGALASVMDIVTVEMSGAFMDCSIVMSQVEVIGTGESQRGRLYNEHHVCRLQLCMGSYVCFGKTQFAWRGGECWALYSYDTYKEHTISYLGRPLLRLEWIQTKISG